MTTVYCVFREAVYRHDCIGVFSTRRMAKAAAEAAADTEHDSHHRFVVVPFDLDAQVRAVEGGFHRFNERDAVYETRGKEKANGGGAYCRANHRTGEGECTLVSGQRLAAAMWGRDP